MDRLMFLWVSKCPISTELLGPTPAVGFLAPVCWPYGWYVQATDGAGRSSARRGDGLALSSKAIVQGVQTTTNEAAGFVPPD